jgi:hypothetical protein
MAFKEWLFYVTIAWSPGPLLPENHKTLMLQFSSPTECQSISKQVQEQISNSGAALRVAKIGCYRCAAIMGKEKCPAPKEKAKAGKP